MPGVYLSKENVRYIIQRDVRMVESFTMSPLSKTFSLAVTTERTMYTKTHVTSINYHVYNPRIYTVYLFFLYRIISCVQ